MSLSQDLRNAWDFRDRDEFERLLRQLPQARVPECTHQLLTTWGLAPGPSYAKCAHCGKDMSSTLDQNQPRCGNAHCGGPRADGECGMKHMRQKVFMGHCMRASGHGVVVSGGTGLPTYQQSGRPLGMVGTVGNQSEPGNQSNLPDHHSV